MRSRLLLQILDGEGIGEKLSKLIHRKVGKAPLSILRIVVDPKDVFFTRQGLGDLGEQILSSTLSNQGYSQGTPSCWRSDQVEAQVAGLTSNPVLEALLV